MDQLIDDFSFAPVVTGAATRTEDCVELPFRNGTHFHLGLNVFARTPRRPARRESALITRYLLGSFRKNHDLARVVPAPFRG
jgi:hypothetical protein